MINLSVRGFHLWISPKEASTATIHASFAGWHPSMDHFRGTNATDQEPFTCVLPEKATFYP